MLLYSKVLLFFFSDLCVDPGFCLNGGTCEVTITGARCHCTGFFEGTRCQECSIRYQGDKCDSCAGGYYGDDCSK